MKALVFAQTEDQARNLCAGARTKADEVVFVAIGFDGPPVGIADKVVRITLPEGAVFDDAADTAIAVFEQEAPDLVLLEPTRRLKVIGGKLAAHARTAVITDVISFEDDSATSMYFGGIALRRLKADGVGIFTVGPAVFSELEASGGDAVEDVAWVSPAHPLRLTACRAIEKSDVDLFKADAVVGAGRGFAEEGQLDLARELCSKIGAGLGCSRPLTEGLDWLPSSVYIGVSGLMLAPKVYIAVGISGQMQHMVGCNRATTLFAVNKDKNAPIFKQCDYGLVGDLKDVLPALSAAL